MHVSGGISGNQPGDPERLATALMTVATQENPPLHLFLGSDALEHAEQKVDTLRQALAANREISISTDFRTADARG